MITSEVPLEEFGPLSLAQLESSIRWTFSEIGSGGGGSGGGGKAAERLAMLERLRDLLHELSPQRAEPVDRVRWVPLDQVCPNDYNPNSVAKIEMSLLHSSIWHDGYTQPVVTFRDAEKGKWVIVDGFHRYFVMKTNRDIYDRCAGLLPIVVIDKSLNERMASTVRHNRARGKHSVTGMSNLVFQMLEGGWSDAEICNELGMTPEEILRLKHITGFSKLFENHEYSKSWVSQRQIRIKHQQGAAQQGSGQQATEQDTAQTLTDE